MSDIDTVAVWGKVTPLAVRRKKSDKMTETKFEIWPTANKCRTVLAR